MPSPRWLLVILALAIVLGTGRAQAQEKLPPKPPRYFNDYANLTSPATQENLNRRLEAYERETSTQILAAIFQELPQDAAIEDYTQRIAESWGVGQSGTDNGAVLFVFARSRKLYLQVGYGLEGAIPDLLAKQIIEGEIAPAFRQGKYDAGMTRGIDAILRAAQGEYRGKGRTRAERDDRKGISNGSILLVFIVLFFLFRLIRSASHGGRGGALYDRRGRRRLRAPVFIPGGFGGWGGGGFGGGGSGGGFSGGGGQFGGGGAGGDW